MLTLFSVPKPFVGEIGEIQRRALESWTALAGVQVVLLGDEEGAAHGGAGRRRRPSPRARAHRRGHAETRLGLRAGRTRSPRHPLRCFVNADIVLSTMLTC